MVFCNANYDIGSWITKRVTILILIDGFLQYRICYRKNRGHRVTILILIDGFLQFNIDEFIKNNIVVTILILIDGFLQYTF